MADLFNIYCDESCHLVSDRSPVMVPGCVWCLRDRVPGQERSIARVVPPESSPLSKPAQPRLFRA